MSDVEDGAANLERGIELRREALEAADLPGCRPRSTSGSATPSASRRGSMQPTCTLRPRSSSQRGWTMSASGPRRSQSSRATGSVQAPREPCSSPRRRRAGRKQPPPPAAMRVGIQVAIPLVWSFRLENARALLKTIEREWGELDERATADALWLLGMVEFRAGGSNLPRTTRSGGGRSAASTRPMNRKSRHTSGWSR